MDFQCKTVAMKTTLSQVECCSLTYSHKLQRPGKPGLGDNLKYGNFSFQFYYFFLVYQITRFDFVVRDVVARGQKVSSSWSSTIIRVKWLAEDNTNCWTGSSSRDYSAIYFTLITVRLLRLETLLHSTNDSSIYVPTASSTLLFLSSVVGSLQGSLVRRKARPNQIGGMRMRLNMNLFCCLFVYVYVTFRLPSWFEMVL